MTNVTMCEFCGYPNSVKAGKTVYACGNCSAALYEAYELTLSQEELTQPVPPRFVDGFMLLTRNRVSLTMIASDQVKGFVIYTEQAARLSHAFKGRVLMVTDMMKPPSKGTGHTNITMKNNYGTVIQSEGDSYVFGNLSNNVGLAIGPNARSIVNGIPSSGDSKPWDQCDPSCTEVIVRAPIGSSLSTLWVNHNDGCIHSELPIARAYVTNRSRENRPTTLKNGNYGSVEYTTEGAPLIVMQNVIISDQLRGEHIVRK